MNRVVHFEIQADDLERAAKFYRAVFGWSIEKWPGIEQEYWMVMTADKDSKEQGISGGMHKRVSKAPSKDFGANAFVCVVDVEDFDSVAAKVLAAGGIVTQPKYALPGMAWVGYFLDTEGNTFGLFQEDKNAK